MNYSNLNKYVSTHMVVIYIVFFLTLAGFLFGLNKVIKGEPDLIIIRDSIKVHVDSTKTHDMFLEALGNQESGNNYRKVNSSGYLGKYQFGRGTLKTIKVKCTVQEFLDQPDLQEFAMEENMKYNKKVLAQYIGEYQFTTFRGLFITESGILAAAHLGGPGSVKKFFKGGNVFKDGNGVPITTYMKRFGGYNLRHR